MSFEKYEKSLDEYIPHYKESYQDGVQSRQAEIDGLQARIDEALRHVVGHGGYDDLTHVINILKGTNND